MTMRKTENPKVAKGDRADEERITHKAFGVIRLSRPSGNMRLFQSDHKHHSFITMEVMTAEVNRTLSNDWVHGRQQLIEVSMSEAQWAAFVSSFGLGSGVPCTIEYVAGEGYMPLIGDVEPRTATFSREVQQTMQDVVDEMDSALKRLNEDLKKLPVGMQKKLSDIFDKVRRELIANMPFVQQQFGEHMERTVASGKAELEAHLRNQMTALALAVAATNPEALGLTEETMKLLEKKP